MVLAHDWGSSYDLYWTDHFERRYRAYTGARQRVLKVVRQALRRRAMTLDWYDGSKAMQGLDELVYELRVTSGDRVLVQADAGRLCLVDVGDHDVTARYSAQPRALRVARLATAQPAPSYFLPLEDAGFFVEADGACDPQWEEELGEEWLHFLSDQQLGAKYSIIRGLNDAIEDEDETYVALVKGGAGTGKTALLLSLAMDYAEGGWSVDFRCSPAVRKHLLDHTKVDMRRLQARPDPETRRVILVDDPSSVASLISAVREARTVGDVGVVAGFDPLQWREKHLSASIDDVDRLGESFKLTTCYRQSEALVELASTVAEAVNERSSWRIAEKAVASERELLRELQSEFIDELEAIKPGGRAKLHRTTTSKVVKAEADQLRDRFDLWHKLPALLVLEDRAHDVKLPKNLKHCLEGIKRVTCGLADVASYKGLDFQAVWMFVDREYFERVEAGKLGLSKVEWEALRDLHIPLTRAKDSTVLFLMG